MPQAQQLGRYLLLDRIAYGGMAEIFRAKTFDAQGRVHLVAVKRVLAHLIEDDEFMQMMVDEAKITALLHHENITELFEFARAGHEYFLAMEFVDGKDLRSLIERNRQRGRMVPPQHAAWVGMQTARGLHAAHTQRDAQGRFLRIVHRDVSPSNVLLSYRGEVKLCDFGIAKATLTRIQTKTGVIKGKVKYMSPEQALGRKLDHRSDLFSLGTVLYELLTHQPPFLAQTEVEQIFAVRECRKRPITDLREDIPPRLVEIIDRAMSRSRSARYQTGEEMAEELQSFIDAHAPGFRRAHFAQYIRHSFAQEIEHELRAMEDYVVAEADETKVGENLIASALSADAPFSRFNVRPPSGSTNTDQRNYVSVDRDPDEPQRPTRPLPIHDEHTMLFDRAAMGLGPAEVPPGSPEAPAPVEHKRQQGPDDSHAFTSLPTQIKTPSPGLHDQPTRLHRMPEPVALPTPLPTPFPLPLPPADPEPTARSLRPKSEPRARTSMGGLRDDDTGEVDLPERTIPGGEYLPDDDAAEVDGAVFGDDDAPERQMDDSAPFAALQPPAEVSPRLDALHSEATAIFTVDEIALDQLRRLSGTFPAPDPTMIRSIAALSPVVQALPAATPVVAPVARLSPARTAETRVQLPSSSLLAFDDGAPEEDTSVPLSDEDLEEELE